MTSSSGFTESPVSPSSTITSSTIKSNICAKYDINATALSVDASGSFAVLAARKGLYIIDLEAPYATAYTLHHQTKWDVTVVKCSPHSSYRSYVASTSNHNALIWNINRMGPIGMQNKVLQNSQPLIATLRGHTRPVSDLSWSPSDPMILATCSADTKIHLWDIRTPKSPVQTLCGFSSGATQIEWNKIDQASIATAHDGEVRVWDTRSSEKTPVVIITAHMQKINGIDWHPRRMYELVTCSEDKTVKLWNVTQPRTCQGSLTTGASVWRTKFTPFGNGLVTISHRLDNTLRLWALSYSESSGINIDQVHAFSGQNDLVKAFDWRYRSNCSDYQLISWSKSQELRMWRVDSQYLEACGYQANYLESTSNEPIELNLPQFSRNLYESKYDLAFLKNDFMPVVLPTSASPLPVCEYNFADGNRALEAFLALENDRGKIDSTKMSVTVMSDVKTDNLNDSGSTDDVLTRNSNPASDISHGVNSAFFLPCPRISGACFSGPNILIVFDSRVAIGQTRNIRISQTSESVKSSKSVLKKLPRTYQALLELRDSRFAKKKKIMKLSSKSDMIVTNINIGSGSNPYGVDNWTMDDTTVFDDGDSLHGYTHARPIFPTQLGEGEIGDVSVHGGSEYLKLYFSASEYHLPVNHPDHRISIPHTVLPAPAGAPLSPRSSTIRASGEHNARVDQASSLNLDLSLTVTLLDLSRLCGFSKILTYETRLVHSDEISCKIDDQQLIGEAKTLSAIQQALLTSAVKRSSLSNICAHNARVALNAGRPDLKQMWSLLEWSAMTNSRMSIYAQKDMSHLITHEPWSAHPFGKFLVEKFLTMYEDLGDTPTLANIVCTLGDQLGTKQGGTLGSSNLVGDSTSSRLSALRFNVNSSSLSGKGIRVFDKAPPMRNPRRSSSYSESFRSPSKYHQVLKELSHNQEFPVALARERQDEVIAPKNFSSPISYHILPESAASHNLKTTPKGISVPTGWKVDFDKLENPFRTWSGSSKDPSPQKLTSEMFQPPVIATSGRDSEHPRNKTNANFVVDEEEPGAEIRVILSLKKNYGEADKFLLSSDDVSIERYDNYKKTYAEVLYKYGAMNIRSEILNLLDHGEDPHEGITFEVLCHVCGKPCGSIYCSNCRDFSNKCSLCQLVVRGQSMFCMNCGHGGHERHMREWFEGENACPTGCGCWCKQATGSLSRGRSYSL